MDRGSSDARRPQKKKSWEKRKPRADSDPGPLRVVCPIAGDKAAYRSYPAAERELLRILAKPDISGEKKPCRVYWCNDGCHLYHLTSQEQDEQWDLPGDLPREAG